MLQKLKQRTSKWPRPKKKVFTELKHVARVAKLNYTGCSRDLVYMQPDRSRFYHFSKIIGGYILC